ncbi:glycosyltransferase [Flavobacteriaceae bacterium AU392]|nr:glycosyltransferase [Flavobacteriaceae bacterium]RKM83514.1 glycosyltransferase [Flavobacteriaceae bacterium AU392]
MHKKLLIIGFVWPEPKSSAAGSRMLQLIEIFRSQEYQITFSSTCAKFDNAFDLKSIGVQQVEIELNDPSFDVFIKELNPDVVLFDRFMTEEQFGWRIAEHCPNALRILDTEDLHCLRKGRQQAFKDESTLITIEIDNSYLFNEIAKREIASIYRSDITLMISEAEIEILKTKFKVDKALLHYLPFLLDEVSSESITTLLKFKERQHFITIGNFMHPPNYDAIVYLKQEIWPLIRQQLPKVELHIYGAYVSQKAKQLHNQNEGFFIKGFVENVNEVMQKSKVCLAPLRFGAGLKGKLIDAMQSGTPCIMTSIAAEGMFGNLKPNGFITDSSKTFAKKAIELYSNQEAWEMFQSNGFKTINNRFIGENFKTVFVNKLEILLSTLKTHRFQNFTGQMLHHHQLQSTKYMSRWIEEKHKH